ncbi:MAG: hypothetical protein ACKO34_04160 [Vampirovibrionales bacterium]
MATKKDIILPDNNDESETPNQSFEELIANLRKLIQSGHLNFLIGSGASSDAIKLMGNIENELKALYDEGKTEEAETKETEFTNQILKSKMELLKTELDSKYQGVLDCYQQFIRLIQVLLHARKTSLLSKQATIFTTNYDLFFEKASAPLGNIILNDGFDRTPSLSNEFVFDVSHFFKKTLFTGTVYGYQSEVPSVNLIESIN